jgi:hypothetical protein
MCSVPPENIFIIKYLTMGNPIDNEKDVFTTPQKDPTTIDDNIINTTDVSCCNLATTDVESNIPTKISASSLANSRKPPPPSSIVLSPSSYTRSQTSRKRSTPEKYVPSYDSSYKSRRTNNNIAKRSNKKKQQSQQHLLAK